MINPWLARRITEFSFTVTTGKIVTGVTPADGTVKRIQRDADGLTFFGVSDELFLWFEAEYKIGVKKWWSGSIDVYVHNIRKEQWVCFFEVDSVDHTTGACKLKVDAATLRMIRSKFF